ncbi:MAG: UDP-N-acetyl-D-glucosamine 2-epimerase, UDP-hydrolysing [Elusimicrobia bacterium RIFOXYA2_FULL_47_53]|nr:MAG: UDP-N-acetyl-D-glucosamine 2-epimerase, UDP-hydrolysing [Elusimicrobia bacterium RIFOXYA12_FULL_49_49]OGS16790.1 MAG: UDP-N-acetyl-D-glucosamine 2-epimerase, UDP-hydrolysing [Elusimicrobia bacterium RIFOXYA2_FULL_47_53]OGS32018.1 MAG: UDP-N-acetyl-D-glucosamine 2-epimerase, UDP-hydrolysing [Elusimicrobia bacterium RIFOXYB2_FULL_46_23]
MKKICFVTGSRAEYGLLKPLMSLFKNDKSFKLQVIVTGMHLSGLYGSTYKVVEQDFHVDRKVYMPLEDDSASGITKAMGKALEGFADALKSLKPDLMVVLGDRYEILAAAQAALIYGVPLAHLHGGELTFGAVDDAIRHAITKMSYLHFTSTEVYRRRVIQMGENPQRVFNVGAVGIDNIRDMKLLSKHELEKELNFKFGNKNIVITFHPVTAELNTEKKTFSALLKAISELKDTRIIFTYPNSDPNNRIIIKQIDDFVKNSAGKAGAFKSLGQLRYLSALKYADAVAGNSSSGIIEAPSFGIPTLNIGSRQAGRERAKSVIDCANDFSSIKKALQKALSSKFKESCKKYGNPYEAKGSASRKIYSLIKTNINSLKTSKIFYDMRPK